MSVKILVSAIVCALSILSELAPEPDGGDVRSHHDDPDNDECRCGHGHHFLRGETPMIGTAGEERPATAGGAVAGLREATAIKLGSDNTTRGMKLGVDRRRGLAARHHLAP